MGHVTLREQGYRYIYRDGQYAWVHPLEVRFDDIDCSDMEDDEFAAFVAERQGVAA